MPLRVLQAPRSMTENAIHERPLSQSAWGQRHVTDTRSFLALQRDLCARCGCRTPASQLRF